MDINRNDDRFIDSKDVLDHVRPEDNLAAMDWEDFEQLIRELFEEEFHSSGGEVRVTQASRDRGVDAIAFDPDPIRGGKFVIQAKRYNMVVPVSAVRDLYGTMISEGAAKGILVTTSYYGRDSREFAKDKPITLIDGENLVYLFQKHGRNLHISLLPKGDPQRGLGTRIFRA
jgi:restriction system protein